MPIFPRSLVLFVSTASLQLPKFFDVTLSLAPSLNSNNGTARPRSLMLHTVLAHGKSDGCDPTEFLDDNDWNISDGHCGRTFAVGKCGS